MNLEMIQSFTPAHFLFLALAGIAAATAVGVVAFNDPVRSALCLVGNFFTLAFLYFTLNAELLGITQVVVYTGAIMVLFLFVLMLLNLGGVKMMKEKFDVKRVLGFGFGALLLYVIGAQVILPLNTITTAKAANDFGGPEMIGRALFTTYVWPFEVASILLLIGVVGSIMLAKRKV
ncbi:MAG TPA: NADH-quinone oxidoreductase subunit J [Fimbriimonadaceae bacterium]|nr:NADH-quinone oxidoreductase subunit J [Fimbriimonadaceae bacterium]